MSVESVSTSEWRGLAGAEAAARLAAEGYDEPPQADRRTPFRLVLDVSRDPMLALPIGGGVIYLAWGDVKEAIVPLAFACPSVAISVVKRTDKEVKGFIVRPKRWVVERKLGWINRARRLSKDVEATIESALARLRLALAFLRAYADGRETTRTA